VETCARYTGTKMQQGPEMTGSRFVVFLLAVGALAVTALLAMPVERYDALSWGDMASSARAADRMPVTAPLTPPVIGRTAESGEHAAVPRLWLR
jgi:hypothetical protein